MHSVSTNAPMIFEPTETVPRLEGSGYGKGTKTVPVSERRAPISFLPPAAPRSVETVVAAGNNARQAAVSSYVRTAASALGITESSTQTLESGTTSETPANHTPSIRITAALPTNARNTVPVESGSTPPQAPATVHDPVASEPVVNQSRIPARERYDETLKIRSVPRDFTDEERIGDHHAKPRAAETRILRKVGPTQAARPGLHWVTDKMTVRLPEQETIRSEGLTPRGVGPTQEVRPSLHWVTDKMTVRLPDPETIRREFQPRRSVASTNGDGYRTQEVGGRETGRTVDNVRVITNLDELSWPESVRPRLTELLVRSVLGEPAETARNNGRALFPGAATEAPSKQPVEGSVGRPVATTVQRVPERQIEVPDETKPALPTFESYAPRMARSTSPYTYSEPVRVSTAPYNPQTPHSEPAGNRPAGIRAGESSPVIPAAESRGGSEAGSGSTDTGTGDSRARHTQQGPKQDPPVVATANAAEPESKPVGVAPTITAKPAPVTSAQGTAPVVQNAGTEATTSSSPEIAPRQTLNTAMELWHEVASRVRTLSQDVDARISLIAEVGSLGPVRIQIQRGVQGVVAELITQSAALKDQLLLSLPRLQDELRNEGIQVEKFSVDVESESSRNGQESFHEAKDRQDREQIHAANLRGATADKPKNTPPPIIPSTGGSGLNLLV